MDAKAAAAALLFGSNSESEGSSVSSELRSCESSNAPDPAACLDDQDESHHARLGRKDPSMDTTSASHVDDTHPSGTPARSRPTAFRGSIMMDETVPPPGTIRSDGKKFNENTRAWETPNSSEVGQPDPIIPSTAPIRLPPSELREIGPAFAPLFTADDADEDLNSFSAKLTDQALFSPDQQDHEEVSEQNALLGNNINDSEQAVTPASTPHFDSPERTESKLVGTAGPGPPSSKIVRRGPPVPSSTRKLDRPNGGSAAPKPAVIKSVGVPPPPGRRPVNFKKATSSMRDVHKSSGTGFREQPTSIKVLDGPPRVKPEPPPEVPGLPPPMSIPSEKSDCGEDASAGRMMPPEALKLKVEPGEEKLLLEDGTEFELHDHQVIGCKWMANFARRRGGCILADDMGLGKTVQTAVLLRNLLKSNKLGHVLILSPKSVLEQWADHLYKLVPQLPVQMYIGAGRENRLRRLQAENDKFGILTTYETFRSSVKDLKDIPGLQRPWDMWIADEATAMKNHTTSLWKTASLIRARTRIFLTGTPIMNRYEELWALTELAQPGLFGNFGDFSRTYACLLNRKAWGTDDRRDKLTRQMRDVVLPYILRRTKEEIFPAMPSSGTPSPISVKEEEVSKTETSREPTGDDTGPTLSQVTSQASTSGKQVFLPRKTDIVVWQDLTSLQREVYESVRRRINFRNRSHLLFNVNYLKKLCRHPVLCLPPHMQIWRQGCPCGSASEDPDADLTSLDIAVPKGGTISKEPIKCNLDEATCENETQAIDSRIDQTSTESLREACPKLLAVFKMLPRLVDGGHTTLIFSESTATLDLLEMCVMKDLGYEWRRIDGSMTLNQRTQAIEDFKEMDEVKVLLLSTGAGCMGLNLTRADRVMILDPSWNPAKDAQAIDRAHRIGQTRSVVVFRFILGGAIEDNMLRLQLYKMNLSSSVLLGSGHKMWFTAKELQDLFSLESCRTSRTRAILTHLTENEEKLVTSLGGDLQGEPEDLLEAQAFASMDDVIKEIEGMKARAKAARSRR